MAFSVAMRAASHPASVSISLPKRPTSLLHARPLEASRSETAVCRFELRERMRRTVRGLCKPDSEFLQPLFRAERRRCLSYHLPTCAPPSTWSTSPVT
jgi:hypothetical protein